MPGLLAPLFLAGFAALAVPIFVHLIDKQQKKPVRFPSLMFLEEIPYKATHRQRIQHWLLFLLRCLLLLLLIFAFARPFFTKNDTLLPTAGIRGGRDVVILLDRSYSMEYGDRWKRAVSAAQDVVKKMSSDDRGTVVYFSGTASMANNLTHEKSELLEAIDSVKPTAGVTRYDAAFQLAKRIFGDTARPNREIVLISDYQRSGLGGRELPPLPEGTTLTQISLGDSVTKNVIVSHGELHYDTANGRERAIVAVHLANRSTAAVTKRITLELNGRDVQIKTIDIPANGTTRVEFPGISIPPGVSRGVVRTDTDLLVRDNMFHFVVAPQKPMSVFVVQPPNAESQASLFLIDALKVGTPSAFDVKVVNIEKLSAISLTDVSLIILNGAPMPGGETGQRIAKYVKNGGGLFVTLGAQSNPASWSRDADSLLPRLAADPIDRLEDDGITLGFVDRGHAIFNIFSPSRSGEFSTARFLHYWNVVAGPDDRQLARFGDGRVALLERRIGLGRVLVWSSDVDGLWNDMPVQPVFLPFLHQAVHYAAGSPNENSWMTVGSVIDPDMLFGERGDAENPNSTESRTEAIRNTQFVAVTPTGAQLRFGLPDSPELDEQGVYRITRSGSAGEATRLIAANIDPAESDLTGLDTALIQVAVTPRDTMAARMMQANTSAALTPEDREQRQRLWWYLLITMLVLLGAETLLSNRLSRSTR